SKPPSLQLAVGSNGWDHDLLCQKSELQQRNDIDRATAVIQQVAGSQPRIFRAPNFSISGSALRYLASRGYRVDSSVMPERVARRWRILPLYDHRGAPLAPYTPSDRRAARKGDLPILEVPVAVDLDRPAPPLGLVWWI